jgi:membrane-associated phospholipid phosphatase
MAIISQRTGISPYRMDAAQLRREFNETAGYMLTTAGHHYRLPLGDGALVCRFDVALEDGGEASSPPLVVSFGRGLPEGVFPRDLSRPPLDGWPTWVVDASFDPGLPTPAAADTPLTRSELTELLKFQADRTPEQITLIRQWDDGSAVGPWVNITLDSVISHNMNPVRAARALALVSVAMYDASVVGARLSWQFRRPAPCSVESRLQPVGANCSGFGYPSEHAVAAGAASGVLAYLFPDQAERFDMLAQEAITTRLWAGAAYRSDVDAGLQLGKLVAQIVTARADSDGAKASWDGQIPASSTWIPTPPDFQATPLEPLAGTWQPWNLTSVSELRPPPPPAPGSDQFTAEAHEVYEVGISLTLEQQEIASFWEDKKGSFTPPGHWNAIAVEIVRSHGLSTPDAALVFATLNTAQADGFIAAWDAKYTYWSERPVTAVRQMFDPKWSPYVYTPPFPSYVSGHSTTSGAASTVLKHFFPKQAAQFDAWAQEAAISRLYGGIHFRSDNDVGLRLGQDVAGRALARIQNVPFAALAHS